ncbi:MAG: ATP-binding protein [Saccharofermentanales bacterium]|jgi:two-component system phosphate regulon sensor histidine kinase PhoR|nr:ATP-binding protein [Bacillota bacterium]
MRKRLIILIVAVVLAAILITGGAGFMQLRRVNQAAEKQYLAAAAFSFARDINDGVPYAKAFASIVDSFANNPDVIGSEYMADTKPEEDNRMLRATVISATGEILYDSEGNLAGLDNHANREEVRLALKNRQSAVSIRKSKTLNQELMYYALYNQEQDNIVRIASPLASLYSNLVSFTSVIFVTMIFAAVLLILIALSNLRKITKPLHQLEEAALALRQGDYSTRIPDVHLDTSDLRELSLAFNEMAYAWQDSHRKQEEYAAHLSAILNSIQDLIIVVDEYDWVLSLNQRALTAFGRSLLPSESSCPLILLTQDNRVEELTARARLEDKSIKTQMTLRMPYGLRRFRLVASPVQTEPARGIIVLSFTDITDSYQAEEMRSEFVANVTHELRSPLTSIRGFIETLRSKQDLKLETVRHFVNIIDVEAERLEYLINDILFLSAIENETTERNITDFDLSELIDEVVVLLDDYAHENKVYLLPELDDSVLNVRADRDRIKQILINLIDNAIKYNEIGGKVWITVRDATESEQNAAEADEAEISYSDTDRYAVSRLRMIVLTVRDNGLGIPADQQDRLFERFYRVERSRSRELGGTGLGLSIVKHIARLYHGYATVESTLGQGSAFHVFLRIGI